MSTKTLKMILFPLRNKSAMFDVVTDIKLEKPEHRCVSPIPIQDIINKSEVVFPNSELSIFTIFSPLQLSFDYSIVILS